MEFSNCRLFIRPENCTESQNGHCELSGEQTWCRGDILYCERSEALRDYVLNKIEKDRKFNNRL